MKLQFGNLQQKADAIQAHRDKVKFERQVDDAMQIMHSFINLPNGDDTIHAYPQRVQHIPLAVLREASRRIRHSRNT